MKSHLKIHVIGVTLVEVFLGINKRYYNLFITFIKKFMQMV